MCVVKDIPIEYLSSEAMMSHGQTKSPGLGRPGNGQKAGPGGALLGLFRLLLLLLDRLLLDFAA